MALAAFLTGRTALRDYLLATLPAKCTTVNALRAAVLKSRIQNFTIPADATLKLSTQGASATTISLTSGTRTAAQVVANIEASLPGIATADSQGRVVITSATAPSGSPASGTRSIVTLGADTTGANAALGWSAGGMTIVRAPLAAPLESTFPAYEKRHYQIGADGSAPRFEILEYTGNLGALGTKSYETELHQTIRILDTAATEDEIEERIISLIRAVQDVIGDDRSLHSKVQFAEIERLQRLPALYTFAGEGIGVPIGVGMVDVFLRVYDG